MSATGLVHDLDADPVKPEYPSVEIAKRLVGGGDDERFPATIFRVTVGIVLLHDAQLGDIFFRHRKILLVGGVDKDEAFVFSVLFVFAENEIGLVSHFQGIVLPDVLAELLGGFVLFPVPEHFVDDGEPHRPSRHDKVAEITVCDLHSLDKQPPALDSRYAEHQSAPGGKPVLLRFGLEPSSAHRVFGSCVAHGKFFAELVYRHRIAFGEQRRLVDDKFEVLHRRPEQCMQIR